MSFTTYRFLPLAACCAVLVAASSAGREGAPRTGPETEKRFPPLKVPPGFKATLFACDPLIEYPSAIAAGPKAGSVFVAVDYMTGLGTEIVRRDEVRLVEDADGDGYADRASVFAGEFNSVQGLAYHDGTLYVMHAPLLTALRDTDGDGKADERRDLLTGLGLRPEDNPVRLHCANGVVAGHDGWLYLALGDHGCDVKRPEGDRLVLEGGGILRCRPDGRDLHVFATGLRNIYDLAFDEGLNVFVRDNENDGGDYKVRVCHSFFGADHGYPYLYYERPAEALSPLADLGLGSSAGGLCYLEAAFPAEFRGSLFFCEWGRAVVRYRPEPAGSSFAPLKEVEFTAGAADDPYGFKPTDLVVQRDGSLLVSDWADGQRPKRGRGRIYRIAPAKGPEKPPRPVPPEATLEQWVAQLDSESYYLRTDAQAAVERRGREGAAAVSAALGKQRLGTRGRLHAVWALARVGGRGAVKELLELARADSDPRVRAQAVRAVADLADPVLAQHRLDAGAGDADLAGRAAALGEDSDPRVLLEVVIALGRLRWAEAPAWLKKNLAKPDPALAHAAMQALRRSQNWPAVLKLLDEPDATPLRAIALRAVSERFSNVVVDGLIDRLRSEPDPARRREYADALTRVHKKPGPWVYWGYRPPPRPPNTVAWERTKAIEQALDRVLADPDRNVRADVLRRLQREKVPTRVATLARWLREEREAGRVAVLLESLRAHPADAVRPLLAGLAGDKQHTPANRLTALSLFAAGLDEASADQLLKLAGGLEDGPVLAEALRHAGRWPKHESTPLLLRKADSPDALVRASAVEALSTWTRLRIMLHAPHPTRRHYPYRTPGPAPHRAGGRGPRPPGDALPFRCRLVATPDRRALGLRPPGRPQSLTRLAAARPGRLVPGQAGTPAGHCPPRRPPGPLDRPARPGADLDLGATGRGPAPARLHAGRPPGPPLPPPAPGRLPPHRLDAAPQAGPRQGRAGRGSPRRLKKKAEASRLNLFYLDESGFSPSLPTGYSWCLPGQRKRVPYEYPQGRRVNVLAAYAPYGPAPWLDALAFERTLASDDLIAYLKERLPAAPVPRVVVLDNASRHISKVTKAARPGLAKLGIYLYYLPAYSPELNEIEAVFKQVKHHEIPKRSHTSKAELRGSVEQGFDSYGKKLGRKRDKQLRPAA